MSNIRSVLNERQKTHGTFAQHADVSQRLKAVMQATPNADQLSNVQREGLEMIQHKIARLLCGNAQFIDSISDIIGYATLIKDAMLETEGAVDVKTTYTKRINGAWVEELQ